VPSRNHSQHSTKLRGKAVLADQHVDSRRHIPAVWPRSGRRWPAGRYPTDRSRRRDVGKGRRSPYTRDRKAEQVRRIHASPGLRRGLICVMRPMACR
jgi:hypothetical protein